MKRRLFTLAAAASLLLCAATAVLWIRSYRVSDALGLSEHVRLFTDRGTLVAFVAEPHSNFYWSLGYGSWELPDPDATFNPRRVSKRTWNVLVAHGESFPALRIVVVQLWAILVLAGFLPVLLFTRIVRQRRLIRRGRCAKCGYDLRATPQRCPECGTAATEPFEAPRGAKER